MGKPKRFIAQMRRQMLRGPAQYRPFLRWQHKRLLPTINILPIGPAQSKAE